MDVAALILAILAIVCFLARHPLATVNLGLALLTAALICQFVALTGSTVTAH